MTFNQIISTKKNQCFSYITPQREAQQVIEMDKKELSKQEIGLHIRAFAIAETDAWRKKERARAEHMKAMRYRYRVMLKMKKESEYFEPRY
ncbi:hypothetical protein HOA56_01215 [archaeon]|jgi:hypothetical protein|nr:hypothetical protein [archaeon]